jgi:TRAP-type C4-dicarboxylate transport system permease small subunit
VSPPDRDGFVERVSAILALLGGCLLLAVGALVTVSVVSRWLTSQPIPGDYDLVQMALAVAAFAFLPICHLHRINIMVDTFTLRAPMRVQRAMDAFWSLVYAAVAALIAWGMAVGARETVANGTTTMMLGVPIGWAMALTVPLAFWLVVVALWSAASLLRRSGP